MRSTHQRRKPWQEQTHHQNLQWRTYKEATCSISFAGGLYEQIIAKFGNSIAVAERRPLLICAPSPSVKFGHHVTFRSASFSSPTVFTRLLAKSYLAKNDLLLRVQYQDVAGGRCLLRCLDGQQAAQGAVPCRAGPGRVIMTSPGARPDNGTCRIILTSSSLMPPCPVPEKS